MIPAGTHTPRPRTMSPVRNHLESTGKLPKGKELRQSNAAGIKCRATSGARLRKRGAAGEMTSPAAPYG
jgi:hypothetical protein